MLHFFVQLFLVCTNNLVNLLPIFDKQESRHCMYIPLCHHILHKPSGTIPSLSQTNWTPLFICITKPHLLLHSSTNRELILIMEHVIYISGANLQEIFLKNAKKFLCFICSSKLPIPRKLRNSTKSLPPLHQHQP